MIFFGYLGLPLWNMVLSQSSGSADGARSRPPFVKYLEPLSYDRWALHEMHREAKPVQLEFRAYRRVFRLRLRQDPSVLAPGFEVVTKGSTRPVDVSFLYSGDLEGEAGSFCHGSIQGGLFEGFIRTPNGTYYIELARRASTNATYPSHSFIHHESDLDDDNLWSEADSESWARELHQRLQDYQRDVTTKIGSPPRPKRSLDYSKTSCLLHLKADYLFYQRFGSVEAVIAQLANYVKAVNAIYEGVEFDGIGTIDFKVKTVTVVDEDDQAAPPFIGPEMLLLLHSRSNWDRYCLSFLLTDRDYSGILGIAFNGQPGDAGGICSKHRAFRGQEASLNTGLITLQKYGRLLPPRMVHITLAHELGHSLGAPHDESKACSRFPLDTTHGKFLMFGYATDGSQLNNDKFSPCSLAYMAEILRQKKDLCFAETDRPICGNRIVDVGEECDVGNQGMDPCCYGAAEPNGIRCRLKPGAVCSPSQGLCCTPECVPKTRGRLCQEETDCASESVCSGSEAKCPAPLPKPNLTLCGMGSRVCLDQLCTGSLCIRHGLEQCDGASASPSERCQLYCQQPGQAETCARAASPIWGRFFNVSDVPLTPGSPCGAKAGYCDHFHVCRFVDEDGPIARVKNFILDLIEMEDVATWMKTRWWAVVLAVLTLAAMMAGTIFLFGRRIDTKTEEATTREPEKKLTSERHSGQMAPFFYWEHEETYIHTMRQEYETII